MAVSNQQQLEMSRKDLNLYLEKCGHELKRDEYGEIDIFVLDMVYHNGPGCILCDDVWCYHCPVTIGNVKICPNAKTKQKKK